MKYVEKEKALSNSYRRIKKYQIIDLFLMTASIFNSNWRKIALKSTS